jgi:hypothetical protein
MEVYFHPEECLRAVVHSDNIAFLAPPERRVKRSQELRWFVQLRKQLKEGV